MGKQFSVKDIFNLIETYALTKANEAIEALRNDASLRYDAEVEAAG